MSILRRDFTKAEVRAVASGVRPTGPANTLEREATFGLRYALCSVDELHSCTCLGDKSKSNPPKVGRHV